MRVPLLSWLLKRDQRELAEELVNLRREVQSLRQRGGKTGSNARVTTNHELLLVIARALRDANGVEEFAGAAVSAVIAGLGAQRGALIVDRKGELVLVAGRDKKGPIEAGAFPWSQSIATIAVRDGEVVATGQAAKDGRFKASRSVARHGLESVLALPLRGSAAATVGCLYLESPPQGFVPLDAATLLATADLVSVALSRLESEAAAERRTRLQTIGLAAAEIAHDLRSPLATAEFALALVKPANSEDETALSRVRASLARARELSRGLVGLATGRETPLSLALDRVAPVIEEHLAAVEDELRATGIEVVRKLDPAVQATFDRSALLRILDNLTRNAQRAMAEGGKLELGCTTLAQAEIWIQDQGPGIAPERLSRIFSLADDARGRGEGLGLVLVNELVLAMGGSIDATSEPGRTRFTVRLRG